MLIKSLKKDAEMFGGMKFFIILKSMELPPVYGLLLDIQL